MNDTVLERFLRYVAIDTQSSEESTSYPAPRSNSTAETPGRELSGMGLADVTLDQWGYVMATLPGNVPRSTLRSARCRHRFDRARRHLPSTSGANVRPQVIQYRGGDIVLPGDTSVVIKESENPELRQNIGKTIVTTDGTTLSARTTRPGLP